MISVRGERSSEDSVLFEHEGARFEIGHVEHRGLVRSESWEVVLRPKQC